MEHPVERFRRAAKELRAAVRSEEPDLHEWTRRVRNGVARACLAAALLPHGPVTNARRPGGASDANEDALAAHLAERLGDADAYVELSDGTDSLDSDLLARAGWISRGLAEIDADLATALEWISSPHDDLLWDLRFAFENHWGRHAVDVLRPLHTLASGYPG